MLMPNGPAAAVSLDLGARAGAHTTVSACASGAESMGYAIDMIRTGRADVVVAGGTEAAVHPLPIAGFAAMQALSTRNDDPTRPRAPTTPAATASCSVRAPPSSSSSPRSTPAPVAPRSTPSSRASACRPTPTTSRPPSPTAPGASRAMLYAVERADLSPTDIIHINAHATSTPVGDIAEYNAIKRAFGDHTDNMSVTATKSMTGHLLGAAGALEAVITILSIHHRLVPATINLDDQDPEIPLNVVTGEHQKLPDGDIAALNNSFGFGGHNVALAIRSI